MRPKLPLDLDLCWQCVRARCSTWCVCNSIQLWCSIFMDCAPRPYTVFLPNSQQGTLFTVVEWFHAYTSPSCMQMQAPPDIWDQTHLCLSLPPSLEHTNLWCYRWKKCFHTIVIFFCSLLHVVHNQINQYWAATGVVEQTMEHQGHVIAYQAGLLALS